MQESDTPILQDCSINMGRSTSLPKCENFSVASNPYFYNVQHHIYKKLANLSSPFSPLTKEGHENKYDSDGGGKGRGSRFCDPKGEERGEGKRGRLTPTDGCKRKRERIGDDTTVGYKKAPLLPSFFAYKKPRSY